MQRPCLGMASSPQSAHSTVTDAVATGDATEEGRGWFSQGNWLLKIQEGQRDGSTDRVTENSLLQVAHPVEDAATAVEWNSGAFARNTTGRTEATEMLAHFTLCSVMRCRTRGQ